MQSEHAISIPSAITPQRPRGRRHKERIRVSRACDYCKQKKIRCTGTQPCSHCIDESRTCEYNAPYARGKKKVKINAPLGTPSATPPTLVMSPGLDNFQEPSARSLETLDFAEDITCADDSRPSLRASGCSSRNSPDTGEQDRQGHFVGASSGLSFLLRLQRKLKKDTHEGPETSVFTLGDAVLPEFDELAFCPPPRGEAEFLLKTYFELASPTYRFLHRQTVEGWMRQLYDDGIISGGQSHSKYAVLLTVFAQADRYTGAASNSPNANTGVQYFQAAERQLSRETQSPSLTSVQALLGSCFYILTRSRSNHCWNLFGTTARMIQALGIHRKKVKFDGSHGNTVDLIEVECRKRLFWCAYNLDKYLSAIFGRPCAFQDDDIDQDMPALVEDSDLKKDSMLVSQQSNMNVMLGPLSHQKLGCILSSTLRRLYGIKPLDRPTQYNIMKELGKEVQAWRQNLPAFLDPDKVDSRLLIPLFQRQSNLLTLAAGHVEILLYRPCLFNDYQKKLAGYAEEAEVNVQRCIAAAMSMVTVIDRMVESHQLYAASWFSHYQAFCAVVVLYNFTLRSKLKESSTWLKYFQAAEKCQGLIGTVASPDSLAQRFCVIMEEFRLEVVRQLQQDSPSPDVARLEGARSNVGQSLIILDEQRTEADASSWLGDSSQVDPLQFLELPNWEQLDTLALDLGGVLPDFDILPEDAFSRQL